MALKRALLSVSDKDGVVEFAKALSELNVELISTGGTKKKLKDAGIDVLDISEFTGFPEMLNGRVKTLHPLVHGGILALRDNDEHKAQVEEHNIKYIDLVCVNLYPFEETIAKENVTLEEAIENIDIGGPTMLRSAAKNYKFVTVVTDKKDYEEIISQIKEEGDTKKEFRFELMKKVFSHTARYDSIITNHFTSLDKTFPDVLNLNFDKVYDLRYGENPHQNAAWYRERKESSEATLMDAIKLQGKELSYNNIADAQACLDVLRDFSDETFALVMKHMNPCGAAIAKSAADAFRKAFAVDSTSAFGGIIGLSVTLDKETAEAITENFAEIVIAPDFTEDALSVLSKKKNLRVLKLTKPLKEKAAQWEFRKISGGLLMQEKDLALHNEFNVVTEKSPSDTEMKALKFAWIICKHVKSNAIVYANENALLGVGAGQMSRVDSAMIAAEKSASPLEGAVMASDAFFPFRDGIDEAAKRGIKAVIQPGGSVRDEEVINACNEHGMSMVFTGMRHFKH